MWQKGLEVQFREAVCHKIDPKKKKVYCRSTQDTNLGGKHGEFSVDYDYLIIAMGAQSNTFNTPGVEQYAHFLKVSLFLNSSLVERYVMEQMHIN